MANPVSKTSNKNVVVRAELPDNKVSTHNPLIHVRDIRGYLVEYEKRCQRFPSYRGCTTEIAMLQNIITRYSDSNEVLSDKDAELFKLLCQNNADNRPPRSKEMANDWLFRQMALDFGIHVIENSSYFDVYDALFGDKV